MIMCIQNLVLIGLFVFKILSKISILTSIKGRNSVANCRNSNSSKLSCMSLLPARMKTIKLKMKVQDCSQDFSHYKSMGIFFRRSRAANSAVLGPIWPNFELVRDVMDVLVTCKYEEYRIKNEGAKVVTTLYINIIDSKWQITQESAVVYG